jgi:glycosyltransferase involved in cell wall biosynthesis
VPTVTTFHGRLDIPDLVPLMHEFGDMPVVSISNAQRTPLPWMNWQTTVYHGLPEDLFHFRPAATGDYLAFLGRISPEKRADRAIEIARRVGMNLRIAAKIDEVDKAYFEAEIKSMMDDPLVEYMGEVGEPEKDNLLGNAHAMLFPIDWPEPFGLVMIESLACGTPVIAWRCGSVPEVMDDGVTGFVVDSIEQAVAAVRRVPELDRARCRAVFEERFSLRRMTDDYLALYETISRPQKRWSLPAVA